MKNHVLILFLSFTVGSVFAQQLKWGTVSKRSAYPDTYFDQGLNFYTVSYIKNAMYMSLTDFNLTRYENLNKVASEKINRKVEEGKGDFFGGVALNGKYISILKQTEKETEKMYYQVYNSNCLPESDPVLIVSFDVDKSQKRKSTFSFGTSENKKFIYFNYKRPGKKEEKDIMVFKVFDMNFQLVQEGEYSDDNRIKACALSNDGSFIMEIKEFQLDEKGRETPVIESYVFKRFENGTPEDLVVDLSDGNKSNFSFRLTENNQLILVSIIAINDKIRFEFIHFDLLSGKEVNRSLIESDFALKQVKIKEFDLDEKGAFVLIIEESWSKTTTTTTSSGTSSRTTYIYNDCAVIKSSGGDQADFMVVIPKNQFSVNDGGISSSLSFYKIDGKLHLLFNDALANYGPDGMFKNPEKLEICKYRSKKVAFVDLELDMATGEYVRKVFLKPQDQQLFAVPIDFYNDTEKRQMLLHFSGGKKEQFGILAY